jgi:DNA-binding MarR family transcriptional regulator
VSPWGGGLWGFLRSLQVQGPQTVPQIARARPVSRQRIQRLADEAAESGLVEFTDNPAHRRSKLVRLTPEGATLVGHLTEKIADISEDLAHGMDEQELRTTAKVLRRLREKLEAS